MNLYIPLIKEQRSILKLSCSACKPKVFLLEVGNVVDIKYPEII